MFLKPIYFVALISCFLCSIWAIFSLKNYQDINTNQIPAFIIQQGKLSQKQIADLTKFNDTKNIWVINDNEDYKRATELIKQSSDVVSYANQVGRLDVVSILLAIIAIIFGFVGIIGFLHIKEGVDIKTQFAINEYFKKDGELAVKANEIIANFAKEYFKDNGQADKIVAKKMEDSTKRKEAEIENDCQLEDEDNLIDN